MSSKDPSTPRRQHIFSGSSYEDQAGYARAVVVKDQIFVSGTVGIDFKTGELPDSAKEQAEVALNTIESALVEADSGLQDVVRVRVFIPNPEDVASVSSVLKARLGFTMPANTTVCTALAVSGCLVEIEAEAFRGSGVSN